MSRSVFRLVLLISCAHALVHVFELSLPAVEQLIGADFGVGKEATGLLGLVWRLPYGLGAVAAGWLADRYGSKPMLLIYLLGCAGAAVFTFFSSTLLLVFVAMFAMGTFASIYHPAGLSLISRATSIENRAAALGWHGVIGSIGFAVAPFLAGIVLSLRGASWRDYFLVLAVPALGLAFVFAIFLKGNSEPESESEGDSKTATAAQTDRRRSFALLVTVGSLAGIVYSGFIYFLPRFLDEARLSFHTGSTTLNDQRFGDYLMALVMLCAIAGQGISGKLARHDRLETMLASILLANAPLLVWMAFAQGIERLFAACALAVVHFMHQPVYNSLIAKYVPHSRRSIGYGISNMLGFGIGALGPAYAGIVPSFGQVYGGLAVVAAVAGVLALGLRGLHAMSLRDQSSSVIAGP
jgi:MFS transporter, FSR family, fosmidomycin resistance protein